MDTSKHLSRSQDLSGKVTRLLQKRVKIANEQFSERAQKAFSGALAGPAASPPNPWDLAALWYQYSVDFAQRSVLFWDTLRQRGNNYLERVQQGLPPVLHFEYQMVLDGRALERPVNYALVRILPPPGVTIDPGKRPYMIIDPRAGHGPGIGGFKDDSQAGVAMREGHPVYFVIFFTDPEPGQTMLDVCAAERSFVQKVRALHPDSPKPAIVGNCQGGWAAMMLASAEAGETGPVVINGAPMSYWGGALTEGEGDNPMRYAGGMLGGSWLASFTADLGNGKFDGAHLVKNFEDLNPANTFWDKYYHVFANADTEPPRFLDFERWWGGYYLMNREEIEWIVGNLFVGNKLWSGDVKTAVRGADVFDLRQIRAPIILFASMGDNITPPQQAFNWVADVYGSTDEIKARGQVIVGLLHQNVGHLGIFVSGKVAKKEHAQIIEVMKSIELLPPGLYGMHITERRTDGKAQYEVDFHEVRLEDIMKRLNRLERADEKPFEAVAAVSQLAQRAYEMFGQPLVQAMSNDFTAKLAREFHPLRLQRWAFSDLNPWLAWLGPAAQQVKAQRQALPAEHPMRRAEAMESELISASLDYYRGLRDAVTEAAFFLTYGNLYSFYLADGAKPQISSIADPRELPFVKDALASIDKGGYPEAFARVAFLVTRKGDVPLSRLEAKQEMMKDYKEFMPPVALDQWRRVRGEQELIASYEPEQAIATLPALLPQREDRERLLSLLDRLADDVRVRHEGLTADQRSAVERVRGVLGKKPSTRRAH
jgi:hypothetical protein